ncbi:MAG: 4Fe-4S dicluster domain-containing protein [Candidatus Eremiobacterota bacterium]
MRKKMRVINRDQCIGCFSCMYACSRAFHNEVTTDKSAMRVRAYAGTEGSFSIRMCTGCIEPDCRAACPAGALELLQGGGVKLIEENCIRCGKCVKACTLHAMQWDMENKKPLPCVHCGICAKFCPNDVIALMELDPV